MGSASGAADAEYLANHLARLVQERRVSRGLTIEELAEAAGFGRNRGKIATILAGHWPTHATLVAVLDALDIPLGDVYPLPDRPTVGQLLSTMRLRRGLRLNDVGAAVGLSGSQILRIERDLVPRSPSIPGLLAWFGVESAETYPPDDQSLLATELAEAMHQRKLSPQRAARHANLDEMTIRLILRGHVPSFATAEKLREAFDLSLETVRPFVPEGTLAEQLRTRQWHSGLTAGEYARAIGLSESGYGKIVVNGVVGDHIAGQLAEADVTTPEATHRAQARHIVRMLDQAGRRPSATTILGRQIDERCIALGILPGDAAAQLGINPSHFRRIRRGARPRNWQRVAQIMEMLHFTEDARRAVREEWDAGRGR